MERPEDLDSNALGFFEEALGDNYWDCNSAKNARWAKELEERITEAGNTLPASIDFDSHGDLRGPLGRTLEIIRTARRILRGEGA